MSVKVSFTRRVATDCGVFVLAASAEGLYRVKFPGEKAAGTYSSGFRAKTEDKGREPLFLEDAAKRLIRYFSGRPTAFHDLPFDWDGFTPFERKVLDQLAALEPCRLISYQELAHRSGHPGAGRAVGQVMRKNPLPVVIPCHRVVSADGGLGGYSKGLEWKRRLLRLEGIRDDAML